MLVAASLWGTTGTARALGPEGADPIAVGSVRLALGGTLLLALAVARGARPRPATWPRAPLVTATLAMAAYQPLFFGGVSRTGVAVGTVVGIGTSPIAGGLLARAVRHERLGARWFVATGLGLAGATLLAIGAGGDGDGGGGAGDPGPTSAERCWSGWRWPSAPAPPTPPTWPPRRSCWTATIPTRWRRACWGVPGLLLVPVGLAAGVEWLGEPDGLAMAAWLGVVTVAVAYPLLTRGLSRIGVGATATLTLAEPATAAALGLVVLGERLRPLGWVGLALVGSGVVLETVGGARDRGPGRPR